MPVDFSKVKLVRPLIGDGQERLYEYISPSDGCGVVVLLRPLPGDKAEEFFARDGKPLTKGAKLFSERAVGWNVADPVVPDRAAALTEANFHALPHPVQKWLVDCMTGYGLAIIAPSGTTEQVTAEKN